MNLSARQYTRTRLISANGACGQMRFNAAHAGGFTTEKGAPDAPVRVIHHQGEHTGSPLRIYPSRETLKRRRKAKIFT